MSYKNILNQKKCSKQVLEKYYNKRVEYIEVQNKKYYNNLMFKSTDKVKMYYIQRAEKALKKKLKREEKDFKTALKLFKNPTYEKKELHLSFRDIKKMAFDKFQLYCRLSRCDKNQMLRLIDTWEFVHYKKAQWWHYFSKFNYPWIAFEIINCRPITQKTNRIQWDQEWLYWKENLIKTIWIDNFEMLIELSNQKTWQIYDYNYYHEKYNHFDKLVIWEKKRLWIL